MTAAIAARIERFDRTYSRFRDDSLVAEAARGPVALDFPADAAPMLALYRELYELTGGAVSPLVGGALEHLGYDAEYRLLPAAGRAEVPTWDESMAFAGTRLTTSTPAGHRRRRRG